VADIVALVRRHPACPLAVLADLEGDVGLAWKAQEARWRLLASTSVSALLHREFPPEVHYLGSLVTQTTRMFLVGPTGAGKTMTAMAMAGGIASQRGFLGWRTEKAGRVLWIDGEMPLQLLQQRFADLARRHGYNDEFPNLHYISWQEADGLLPDGKWAPLNTSEGQDYLLKLVELIQPAVVFFDNVQSLIVGDMKDEVPWNDTMPLVLALTQRCIGQVWCDHTGHDQARQYGSSRKAWPFDAVMMILPVTDAAPGELALSLSFDAKARRRTPETWQDYASRIIRLREDQWTSDADDKAEAAVRRSKGRPAKADSYANLARRFLADLISSSAAEKGHPSVPRNLPSVSSELWKATFYSRTTADPADRKAFSRASGSLIAASVVAKKGDRVWLTHPERDSL
jgi:hypothetical protein